MQICRFMWYKEKELGKATKEPTGSHKTDLARKPPRDDTVVLKCSDLFYQHEKNPKPKFLDLASRASTLWLRATGSTLSPTFYHREASSSFVDPWIALFLPVSYFHSLLLQSTLLSLFLLFLSPTPPPSPPNSRFVGSTLNRSILLQKSPQPLAGVWLLFLLPIWHSYEWPCVVNKLYCNWNKFLLPSVFCFISILEAIDFYQIYEFLFFIVFWIQKEYKGRTKNIKPYKSTHYTSN